MNLPAQKPEIDEVFRSLPREKAPERLAAEVMRAIRSGNLDVSYQPRIVEAAAPPPAAAWLSPRLRHYMELAAAALIVLLGAGLLYNPGQTRRAEPQLSSAPEPPALNLREVALTSNPADALPGSAPAYDASRSRELRRNPFSRLSGREAGVPAAATLPSAVAAGQLLEPSVSVEDHPVYKNFNNVLPGANLVQAYRAFVNEPFFKKFFSGAPPKLLIVSNFDKLPAIEADGPFVTFSRGGMQSDDAPPEPYNLILKTVAEVVQKNCNGRVVSWELMRPENNQTSPVLMVTCIADMPDTAKIKSVFSPEKLVVPDRSPTHKCQREVKVVGPDLVAANTLDLNDSFNAQIANVRKVSLEEAPLLPVAATNDPAAAHPDVSSSQQAAVKRPVKFDLYCRMVRLNVDIDH